MLKIHVFIAIAGIIVSGNRGKIEKIWSPNSGQIIAKSTQIIATLIQLLKEQHIEKIVECENKMCENEIYVHFNIMPYANLKYASRR